MVWTVKNLGKMVGCKMKMEGFKMKMVEGGKTVGGSKSGKMVGGSSKVVGGQHLGRW